MKPLPSAALTREDLEIWKRVITRYLAVGSIGTWVSWWPATFEAERHDAELMWVLQKYRTRFDWSFPGCIQSASHLAMIVRMIDEGGDLGTVFNITSCA